MNAKELLREWPQWRNAGAEAILDSPAFVMPVEFKGGTVAMRQLPEAVSDTLGLVIRFEDETCRLELGDSPEYPDLHLLWNRRGALPSALLLALVEAECGHVLMGLERAAQRQLSIVALAEQGDSPSGSVRPFQMGDVRFNLEMTQLLSVAFGTMDHLDYSHESIRRLPREATAVYAEMPLTNEEIAGLAPGDRLLLPADYASWARWQWKASAGDGARLVSPDKGTFTFGDIMDEQLPPVPAADAMQLVSQGRALAEGTIDSLGEMPCFKLTRLL